MVNVVVFGDGVRVSHEFGMDKTIGEVLDEVVRDPIQRSASFIIFMGNMLLEATKLHDVPKMKDKYTLFVMQRGVKRKEAIGFDYGKFRECRKMLKKLNSSRKFVDLLNASLHDDAFCSAICNKFPALKDDWVAYRMFSDSSLWSIFLRPSSECKDFFEQHPMLVEVYYHVLNSLMQRVNATTSGLVSSESGSTLANTNIEETTSGLQEPGQSRHLITSDMLRQAMAGALASVNSSSNITNMLLEETTANPYSAQIIELESLGFTDVEQNMNALEATNGDVSQAIELLIVMRESMEN